MKELKQYWTAKNDNRQTTNFIVIHHAAATYRKGDAVRVIHAYHSSKWPNYSGIGYHAICQEEQDNSIQCYLVNPPNMIGAGVANRNHETFHICLATNLTGYPEARWIDAAREAYQYARKLYPNARLVGHKDIALSAFPTSCPGKEWPKWKADLESIESDVLIVGNRTIPIEILNHHVFTRSPHLTVGQRQSIVSTFTSFGELTRIGNVYPFMQAAKETGWFSSSRFLRNNNPAGLGATDDGAEGARFDTIEHGILAQYAHLLCYATKAEENAAHIEVLTEFSPRKDAMIRAYGRGSARTWLSLSRKWATDKGYGKSIIEMGSTLL
jgi:hypothetical protein